MSDKNNQITKEGLDELKQELKEKLEDRARLRDQMDNEIGAGDIKASLYRTQEEIAGNEKRINELNELIKNAEVVENNSCNVDNCTAEVGRTVTLKRGEKELVYKLVGGTEADPTQNKVSIESPIGSALDGKKTGEKVKVNTPLGPIEYDIISVS